MKGIILLLCFLFHFASRAQVVKHPTPVADFFVSGKCFGDTSRFLNTSGMASSFEWNFLRADSSLMFTTTDQHPVFLFDSVGYYIIQLIASNGHYDTAFRSIRIDTLPQAEMLAKGFCFYDTTYLYNRSECSDSVQWLVYDSAQTQVFISNQDSATLIIPHPGTYQLVLVTVNQFGQDTAASLIVVEQFPEASFVFSDFCQSWEVEFISLSTCASSFQWNFGDTISSAPALSTDEIAYHHFDSIGTYKVVLTVSNQFGTDTSIAMIEITEIQPQPSFSWVQDGDSIRFFNTSEHANSYKWFFGDFEVSFDEHPVHSYDQSGTYDVTLGAYNDCFYNSAMQQVSYIKPVSGDNEKKFLSGENIWPNPASDRINIFSKEKIINLTLFNPMGEKVLVREENIHGNYVINISYLSKGIYFLKIDSENGSLVRKIGIQ